MKRREEEQKDVKTQNPLGIRQKNLIMLACIKHENHQPQLCILQKIPFKSWILSAVKFRMQIAILLCLCCLHANILKTSLSHDIKQHRWDDDNDSDRGKWNETRMANQQTIENFDLWCILWPLMSDFIINQILGKFMVQYVPCLSWANEWRLSRWCNLTALSSTFSINNRLWPNP